MDMGEPVKIIELARTMIHLAGHREDEIGIVFSGLRPGEKLYEELLADADHTLPSAHPRLRIALLHTTETERLVADLDSGLNVSGSCVPDEAIKRWLHRYVPEYRPS